MANLAIFRLLFSLTYFLRLYLARVLIFSGQIIYHDRLFLKSVFGVYICQRVSSVLSVKMSQQTEIHLLNHYNALHLIYAHVWVPLGQ